MVWRKTLPIPQTDRKAEKWVLNQVKPEQNVSTETKLACTFNENIELIRCEFRHKNTIFLVFFLCCYGILCIKLMLKIKN